MSDQKHATSSILSNKVHGILLCAILSFSLPAFAEVFINEVGSPFSTPYYTGNGYGPYSHDGDTVTCFEDTQNPSFICSEHVFPNPIDLTRISYHIMLSALSYGKYAHDIHAEYYVQYDNGSGYVDVPGSHFGPVHYHWDSGDNLEAYGASPDSGWVDFPYGIPGVIRVRIWGTINASAGEDHGSWAHCYIYEFQAWCNDFTTPTPSPAETASPSPTSPETVTPLPTGTPCLIPATSPSGTAALIICISLMILTAGKRKF